MPDSPELKVLFVAAEAAPFAKVGGLADVANALPAALRRLGVDARLIIPCYQQILDNRQFALDSVPDRLQVSMAESPCFFSVKKTMSDNVPVYLLDFPYYFNRNAIYGFNDDADRFIAFSKGVLECLRTLKWQPDVIHSNDWQAALIPALLGSTLSNQPFYNRYANVFSIHNLAYQGVMDSDMLTRLGVPYSEFTHHKFEFFGNINLLKGGIVYSDRICTVSPTYAREILTEEYGEGLDGLLKAHEQKLSGIINGIDPDEFNPETDQNIVSPFTADNLGAKVANKSALLREMGFTANESDMSVPLIGMVTRLADQKGLDILIPLLKDLFAQNIHLVILGEGEEKIEEELIQAAEQYPEKMALRTGFDEALARRIYAGSDIFLMPSKFEPCGLGQMIAMRYGAAPVVRSTGGLADTVTQFDPSALIGNGFVFNEYSSVALFSALQNTIELYHNHKNAWESLIRKNMELDFSWDKSAYEYVDLYKASIESHKKMLESQNKD